MNTKLFTFSKRDDNEIKYGGEGDETIKMIGGLSIPKYLQSYRLNTENNTNYKRFQNLVIPVGLPVNNTDEEFSLLHDENDNHYSVIDSKRFETLLFSVGKDLGISRPKLNSNKTKKRIIAKNRIA